MVTQEDVMVRHKLKHQIVAAIERVVKSILDNQQNEESPTAEPLQSNENQIPTTAPIPSHCLPNFLFPLKTFHLLQDKRVLPEIVQGKRIKYELDSNRLLVKVMASPARDAAANAWNDQFVFWSRNGMAGPKTLIHCGQGRTC